MKKILVFLFFYILFVNVANGQTLIQKFYFDFGPSDGTNGNKTSTVDKNGNYWNNIDKYPKNSVFKDLVNSNNNSTNYSLTITKDGFGLNGLLHGGLQTPFEAQLSGNEDFAVETATQDFFYVANKDVASFKISGLDKSKLYRIKIFGSRNVIDNRTSSYEVVGNKSEIGVLPTSTSSGLGGVVYVKKGQESFLNVRYSDVAIPGLDSPTIYKGNNSTVFTSKYFNPDQDGNIQVFVSSPTENLAYVNAVKLEEYTPCPFSLDVGQIDAKPETVCSQSSLNISGFPASASNMGQNISVSYQWKYSLGNTVFYDVPDVYGGKTENITNFPFDNKSSNALKYYFKREASATNDEDFCVDFSDLKVVTVKPYYLSFKPNVLTDNANFSVQKKTLIWSAVQDATSYEVELSTDISFGSLVENVGFSFLDSSIINQSSNHAISTTTTSITFSSLPSGEYYFRVRAVSDCGKSSYSNVFKFSDITFSNITATVESVPKCSSKFGNVKLSNIPIGKWLLSAVLNDKVVKSDLVDNLTVNASYLFTNLAANDVDYQFIVSEDGGTLSKTINCNVNVPTAIWKDGIWSTETPTLGIIEPKNVVFSSNYNESNTYGTLKTCDCIVKQGAVVNIERQDLLVDGDLLIEKDAQLNIIGSVVRNSSFVQKNINSKNNVFGAFNYYKTIPDLVETDFVFLSSPVIGQTLAGIGAVDGFSPQYFFEYTPVGKTGNPTYIANRGVGVMQLGKGYLARAPKNFGTTKTDFQLKFSGTPFVGDFEFPVVKGRYNLLANPYPAPIKIDYLIANPMVSGIYFWTNTIGKKDGSYTSEDYAVCNKTGCVSAVSGTASYRPNGYISAGQSVFVKIEGTDKEEAKLLIKNESKSFGVNEWVEINNNTNKSSSSRMNTENRIWLNVKGNDASFKQILVGFSDQATEFFDVGFDAESLQGNSKLDFYSILDNHKLAIQGKSNQIDSQTKVNLGMFSQNGGVYSISIGSLEGFSNQEIWLEDQLLSKIHNLKTDPYVFETENGNIDNRFVVRFATDKLSVEPQSSISEKLSFWNKEKQLFISANDSNLAKIQYFDLQGRCVYTNSDLDIPMVQLDVTAFVGEMFVVQVTLKNGKQFVEKMVFR